ncbi:unnamed protein product, partial [Amoebophrya sp. A120]
SIIWAEDLEDVDTTSTPSARPAKAKVSKACCICLESTITVSNPHPKSSPPQRTVDEPLKLTKLCDDGGHYACKTCTTELLKTALRSFADPVVFPARCCPGAGHHKQFVKPEIVRECLSPAEFLNYMDKFEEAVAEEKIFCPNPNCGKFIIDGKKLEVVLDGEG